MGNLLGSRVSKRGEIKMVNPIEFPVTSANFDTTGLGIMGTVAEGYAICNGNSGTFNGNPYTTLDLRGVAPIGAVNVFSQGAGALPNGVVTNYSVGDVVGEEKHSLTVEEMPPHTHGYANEKVAFNGANEFASGSEGERVSANETTASAGGTAGTVVAHENRQPSKAVLYLQVV